MDALKGAELEKAIVKGFLEGFKSVSEAFNNMRNAAIIAAREAEQNERTHDDSWKV